MTAPATTAPATTAPATTAPARRGSRRAGTSVLAALAFGGLLAVAPAASASTTGAVSCRTVIGSSATSATSTTTTHCLRDGRQVAAPAGRGTGCAVAPGVSSGTRAAAAARGWISTGLHFRNSTASTVSVTIMYYDPTGCAGYGSWGTQGWWNVAPGAEVNVKNTINRYATFYAHSDRLTWAGPYSVYVRSAAFQSCSGIGSTASYVVGERLVDLGDTGVLPYTTYTVNLTG